MRVPTENVKQKMQVRQADDAGRRASFLPLLPGVPGKHDEEQDEEQGEEDRRPAASVVFAHVWC